MVTFSRPKQNLFPAKEYGNWNCMAHDSPNLIRWGFEFDCNWQWESIKCLLNCLSEQMLWHQYQLTSSMELSIGNLVSTFWPSILGPLMVWLGLSNGLFFAALFICCSPMNEQYRSLKSGLLFSWWIVSVCKCFMISWSCVLFFSWEWKFPRIRCGSYIHWKKLKIPFWIHICKLRKGLVLFR